VRSIRIIVLAPRLDLGAGVVERQEPVDVQTLIAEAAVERLNIRIIRWFARSGEVQRDVVIIRLAVQGFADELASVVHLNAVRRRSVTRFDPVHYRNDVVPSKGLPHTDRETVTTIVIDDS